MLHSLLKTLVEAPLAVIDTETTGASAEFGHRVMEVGIVRYEEGRRVAEYSQLLDPRRQISGGVTALTGITQEMVTGQPIFSAEFEKICGLMRGAVILGHNVRFDLAFLRREFRRCGQELIPALGDVPVVDTVRIARRRFGRGGNALQSLAPRLGVVPTCAHRALADAITTAGVFEKLIEAQGGWNIPLADVFMAQGGPMGLVAPGSSESVLPLELEEALEAKKTVMMEYLDANQFRTHRQIQPMYVRRFKGELILVAHCQLRNAQRTFKLDRIVRMTRIDVVPVDANSV